jgi:gliding motility-associated-like protein
VSYVLVGKPEVGLNSTLKLNPDFDGKDNANLLIADTTSQLAVSKMDSIFYTVKVFHNGHSGPYESYAYAKAIGSGQFVSDVSNDGVEIKPSETSPTVVKFPWEGSEPESLLVPEGFSPNNDGKNDVFVISHPNNVVVEELAVYNRWGALVYLKKNYENDWDGKVNQGLLVGNNKSLPDGTYFYSLKLSGITKAKVGYLTLAR